MERSTALGGVMKPLERREMRVRKEKNHGESGEQESFAAIFER